MIERVQRSFGTCFSADLESDNVLAFIPSNQDKPVSQTGNIYLYSPAYKKKNSCLSKMGQSAKFLVCM